MPLKLMPPSTLPLPKLMPNILNANGRSTKWLPLSENGEAVVPMEIVLMDGSVMAAGWLLPTIWLLLAAIVVSNIDGRTHTCCSVALSLLWLPSTRQAERLADQPAEVLEAMNRFCGAKAL